MDIEIGSGVRAFLAWWTRELAAMLPAGIRSELLGGDTRLEVIVEGGVLGLALVTGGVMRRAARFEHATLSRDRRARRAIASLVAEADEIVLRLAEREILRPTFDLPLSAGSALQEKLAAEIGRRTPFRAGDVLWDWRLRASDIELERLYVELLIARRREAEVALEIVAAAGITPDRLDGPDETGTDGQAPFDLLPEESRKRRRGGLPLMRPLALAALVLLVAWGATAIARRNAELSALEARLEALRAENAVVTAMESQFEDLLAARFFLAERKRAAVPAIEILADVTRRLPDGDWVHGYAVSDGKLTIDGFSRDASRLPNLLEASGYLSAVAFAAPVRRNAQQSGDDFTITAALETLP